MSSLAKKQVSNLELLATNIEAISKMSRDELRDFISGVEEEMKNLPQIQIEIPVEHYFSKGVYAREMRLPQGALIVGKIHKYENLNICSSGHVSVLSIDGAWRVKAPFTKVGSPGAKRIIFAHEDTVWTTIHGTEERDIEKIESEFIAKDYSELEVIEAKEVVCLGSQ